MVPLLLLLLLLVVVVLLLLVWTWIRRPSSSATRRPSTGSRASSLASLFFSAIKPADTMPVPAPAKMAPWIRTSRAATEANLAIFEVLVTNSAEQVSGLSSR